MRKEPHFSISIMDKKSIVGREKDASFEEPGQETVMHINGDFTWRAKTDNNAVEYPLIAQGFKLIQHAHGKRMYIDNMVAGSIIAPHSEVILAQSRKLYYGKIYAEKFQCTGMPSYIMWTSAQFQTT